MEMFILYAVLWLLGIGIAAHMFAHIFEVKANRKKQSEMAQTLREILAELKARK